MEEIQGPCLGEQKGTRAHSEFHTRACAASHQWLSLVDGIGTLLQASSATHHHSSLSTTTHLHTARRMIPTTRSRCRAPHSRPPRPERARFAIILHAQAWLGGTRSHERQRVHVARWSARNRWFRGPAGRPASAPHGEMHFLFFIAVYVCAG